MVQLLNTILSLIEAGWLSLLDYLAAHVLLCLVPAFIIAGYISAMIPKEVITRYLGPRASRWVSYPAAALGGFILAVCSCTVLPLFAGIWKRGAGLGVAITFLFVGPAVNILAIAYTGAAIGMDVAIARIVLSISFGILIGLIMAYIFRAQEAQRAAELAESGIFEKSVRVHPAVWIVFLLLMAVLIIGTLQVSFLTATWIDLRLPFELPYVLVSVLESASLNPQGAMLIILIVLIAPVAYLGLENVLEKFNRWTYLAVMLVGVTILFAAPVVETGSLVLGITGRFFGELILLAVIGVLVARYFNHDQLAS